MFKFSELKFLPKEQAYSEPNVHVVKLPVPTGMISGERIGACKATEIKNFQVSEKQSAPS